MLKTPDEIKKGLECCISHFMESCNACPYAHISGCARESTKDALAYIKLLEAENTRRHEMLMQAYENNEKLINAVKTAVENLNARCKHLEAERDAAVKHIRLAFTSYPGACETCAHCEDQLDCDVTVGCARCEDKNCVCNTCDNDYCNWEWRGVQKEESKE